MLKLTNLTDLTAVYDYQMRQSVPYFFPANFSDWIESFENDIDGEGRLLFQSLQGKAAYDGDTLVGFVQYGYTAFGFDSCGEISEAVNYLVIRSVYFDENREDAGHLLLRAALKEFEGEAKVYAFFHYFGMSCFARHGKLFEKLPWIQALLRQYGFETEHENVYYSSVWEECAPSEVALAAHGLTKGSQQTLDFMLGQRQIGGCEVHYLSTQKIAYLRWIYVNDDLQDQGMGSKCMNALKAWLQDRGITRLDTDTALDNHRAQHYYEKNGFTREGITRSFFLIK